MRINIDIDSESCAAELVFLGQFVNSLAISRGACVTVSTDNPEPVVGVLNANPFVPAAEAEKPKRTRTTKPAAEAAPEAAVAAAPTPAQATAPEAAVSAAPTPGELNVRAAALARKIGPESIRNKIHELGATTIAEMSAEKLVQFSVWMAEQETQ